ncbi:MAG: hypothetical protein ACFCVC_13915 [Acidimicrobiia bacterium]
MSSWPCGAIEGSGPIAVGNLGGMANPDEEVMGTVMAYADDHRDGFGVWFAIEASIAISQLPITSTWIDTIRNRVGIVLVDPTEADLDTLAASAPSDALCIGETRTPQPPTARSR